jgi:hypothetical protein
VTRDAPRGRIERDVEIGRRRVGRIGPDGRARGGRSRRPDPRRQRRAERERNRRRPRQGADSGPRPGAAIAVDAAASPTPMFASS